MAQSPNAYQSHDGVKARNATESMTAKSSDFESLVVHHGRIKGVVANRKERNTEMSIARLPLIVNGDYICIREAIEACLTALQSGDESSFTLTFLDAEIPVLSFYVQAEMLSGVSTISIEAQRVTDTEDLVLRAQDLRAKVYGWTVPDSADENPNYSQKWNMKTSSARRIAEELVEAVKYLGRVKPDAWIRISPESLSNEIQASGLFWAKNGNLEVMCQIGQNIKSTIEGSKRIEIEART